ncbi:patatin-like phospholipase family protein [Haloflavibacter putidus]|uniref:Patatin n=1 Tax=Haloflavibacter putidus TaxID=2576776 RepID=A0A507ZL86_9FLAO|nr:patatin-like phospholipase family protein [Haloflavibacter putidus]TQD36914.1 patatin [Haloflavibacter putidus]
MRFLSLLIIFFSFSVFAQNPVQKDVKVGLVLSGGGAKGLAHIGALKVIDEVGVRIDYIGGSSMGAIVGALYASGYSPQELDSIFRKTNFRKLIQDDLPRGVKSFYEREEADRYAITLPFNNFNLTLPSSLSKGQNLYNLLSRLTAHVHNIEDFSKLPIPFFCTGTDIETGKQVILDSGSLPQAVAASGAIPSLFSPVLINDQLVADGGISNNYPVEILKGKNVDYIVGVDVQDTLVNRKKLQSALEILTQVNNFRTIQDMENKIAKTDLYINPDIRKFSILSFDEGAAIIDSGETAARKNIIALKQLAKRQSAKSKVQETVLNRLDSISINHIKISGNSTYPRNYITGKLKLPLKKKISYRQLNEAINRLSATGNFQRVEYQLKDTKQASKNLNLIVRENQNNTNLRFALHYDELYESAALVNLTHKSLFLTNDVTSLDIIVGDNFRYNFNYYIDKGNYWSIGLNSTLNQFDREVGVDFLDGNSSFSILDINELNIDYLDLSNRFYIETFLNRVFKFGMGLEHKYMRVKTKTFLTEDSQNPSFTILEESSLFAPYGYLEYDTYNHAYFPTEGAHFMGDFHLYLVEANTSINFSEFSLARGSLGVAKTIFKNFAVRLSTETGFKIGSDQSNVLNFYLGGYGNNYVNNIKPFYGYDFLSISGDSYIKASLELDYEIFKKNHLIASYNIANAEDDIFRTTEWISTPDYTGFAIGYGLETFLGPLEAKYSYSPERAESEWFLSLGFWF